MVENKKKVVSTLVAATALTGAFAAPATAQGADKDAQISIQEESSANLRTKNVNSTKENLDNLQAEADKAINTATNLRNTAQTKLELARTAEETAKQGWETNFNNARKKAEIADNKQKEGKNNRANILREEAEKFIVIAEGYRQYYEVAKLQFYREQDNLQKAENNLLRLRQSKTKYMN